MMWKNPLCLLGLMAMGVVGAMGAGLAQAQTATPASAPAVEVRDAWVRTTVPGQKATGAFMKLTAKSSLRLVGASTPGAGLAEVHEMKMDGDVMKMRALDSGLALPAGQTVELKPGGYHLMLMDLKAALPKDSKLPLTLVFKDARGQESRLELQLPVGVAPPPLQSSKP